MRGKLITVFGGGGFVGRYVCEDLLAAGARVRVAQRNPQSAIRIKPLGNLGQVQLVAADVTREDSVMRAVHGADMVVNLVGSFDNMDQIQHRAAAIVAKSARAAGAKAFIHMSAIGADSESDSLYGRSKGDGEVAVREAFESATILRPSIIFGREDQFVNRFAGMIRFAPVMPVIGSDTKFQPVFVGDVAQMVACCLRDPPAHAGKIYELGGPQVLSMMDLNRWIASAIGRSPVFVPVPDLAAKGLAIATGWMPGAPITPDQYRMLAKDNVVTGANGFDACGISETSLDAAADDWLDIYRKSGRYSRRSVSEITT